MVNNRGICHKRRTGNPAHGVEQMAYLVTVTFSGEFGSEVIRKREAATLEAANKIATEYKAWRGFKSATVKAI